MDCDDVVLLVAVAEGRTLSGVEERELQAHIAGCAACRVLANERKAEGGGPGSDGQLRWIAQVPADALDDPDLLVLPTVNPIVFEIDAELGKGGMGRILRARDRRLGRDVAIKEMLDPLLRARFEREAMITARLQHPAIVPIYEAGNWPDGSAFYTMRLVAGGTLADAIARTQTLEERLALLPHVVALTEALGYAHAHRIVHRDLKPANVLVGEFGETVVIDWGLAKELDRGDREAGHGTATPASLQLTRAGAVVGTPCFMAPEQAAGEDIDERADVYALGSILYNLLVGDPPYWDSVEHSVEPLLAASRSRDATPIEKLVPRVPDDLRAIVERAMARDKAARFATAGEMAEELRRFETGQLLRSREYRMRDLLLRRLRKHRAAVTVGAIAATVLVIGGIVSVQQIVARERETRVALAESQRASAVAAVATGKTQKALAETQLERGRQLLVDGDPGQAVPSLVAALAELPTDPVALRLATIALRPTRRRLGGWPGTTAAFRADGDELALGQADGSIVVVDPASATVVRTLRSVGSPVAALAYSPDGAQLAVAAKTGAYLRDARTGQETVLGNEEAFDVAFVPGADRLVITSAHAVRLVRLAGTPSVLEVRVEQPYALAVSRDGACLSVLTADAAIAWSTAELRPIVKVPSKSGPWFGVACGRGGLFTAGVDGVHRWDVAQRDTLLWSKQVNKLSWLDSNQLVAGGSVIHVETGKVTPIGRWPRDLSAAIDDTHVITGDSSRTLRIWDVQRSAYPQIVLDAADGPDQLIVDPRHGRAVSRGAAADADIELWDVHVDKPPAPVTIQGSHGISKIYNLLTAGRGRIAVQVGDQTQLFTADPAGTLALAGTLEGVMLGFRPQDGQIATRVPDGTLRLYRDRDPVETLPCPKNEPRDPIWHVAFARTGTAMVIGCQNSLWRRTRAGADWHVVTSAPTSLEIASLALDDEGRVAVGYNDGHLQLWPGPPPAGPSAAADPKPGAPLFTTKGHSWLVSALELRNGTLVSMGWDGVLRKWALPSGASVGGVMKDFQSAAISPDGAWIATVNRSAAVSLWDAKHDRIVQQIPTMNELYRVVFLDDVHLVVAGETSLELIDLSVPPYTAAELSQLADRSRGQRNGDPLDQRGEDVPTGDAPAASPVRSR